MKRKRKVIITLNQKEIEQAVRQYITDQGINLTGKSVSVNFTATRSRETGIVAELSLQEPGDTSVQARPQAEDTTLAPSAVAAANEALGNAPVAETKVATLAAVEAAPVVEPDVVEEPAAETKEEPNVATAVADPVAELTEKVAEAKVATTSLFG